MGKEKEMSPSTEAIVTKARNERDAIRAAIKSGEMNKGRMDYRRFQGINRRMRKALEALNISYGSPSFIEALDKYNEV